MSLEHDEADGQHGGEHQVCGGFAPSLTLDPEGRPSQSSSGQSGAASGTSVERPQSRVKETSGQKNVT